MGRKTTALLTILLAWSTLECAAETSLTVEQAVSLALERNLGLGRTALDVEAKRRAYSRSRNALMPTVNAAGSLARDNEAAVGEPEWVPTATVSVSLNLSPALGASIKSAKLDYEAGLLDYGQARRELELSTRLAFSQLLLYRENVTLAAKRIETARSLYEQTAARAKIGQVSHIDVLSAQVDLEKLKPELKRARVAYAGALDQFKEQLGLGADEELALAGSLENEPAAKAVSSARRNGEDQSVSELKRELAKAEESLRGYKEEARLPSLSMTYSSAQALSAGEWSDRGALSVGLRVNLDGLLGFSSTQEKIDKYGDTIASLRSRIAEAERSADTSERQLRRAIEESFDMLEALALNLKLAEKSYSMTLDSYHSGSSDLQDVKSAGDNVSAARVSLLEERYSLASSILRLESLLNLPYGSIAKNASE